MLRRILTKVNLKGEAILAKTKKIKFELLVVTEGETKRKSWKPSSVLRNLIITETREFMRRLLAFAALIFVCFFIGYSDNLIKKILTWLIRILKDI